MDFKDLDKKGLSKCTNTGCPRMACKRKTATGEEVFFENPIDEQCMFYVLHEMVGDEKHVFRAKRRRHNKHAPPPGTREPDLMVKRHIVSGKDINNEDR